MPTNAPPFLLEGSMYDWTEEVELQRRALALALSANEMAGRSGREPPAGVPVWAQVARVQALQSIALMAPTDRDLRAALYEVNIVQVSGWAWLGWVLFGWAGFASVGFWWV